MIIKFGFLLIVVLVTIYVYYAYGGKTAFSLVSLPMLVTVPMLYGLELTPGLPLITFYVASALPLFLLVWYREPSRFQFRAIDWLIVLFAILSALTTFPVDGFQYAGWTLFNKMFYNLIPYFTVRILFDGRSVLRVLVAMGLSIAVIGLFSPLEYLNNIKVAQVVQILWPDWVMVDPFVRGGYYRVFSTFGHPIYAGMAFCLSIFFGVLSIWLKVFRTNRLPWFMILVGTAALYMTVSRTSYVLIVPILLLMYVPFAKNRVRYGFYLGIGLVLALVIVLPIWNAYVASGAAEGADETATSAAYRAILFDNYIAAVWASPWYGHGFNLPIMGGQPSIDNYYLYLLLRYGIPNTILYGVFTVLVLVQGTMKVFRSTVRREQIILWSLLCILLYLGVVGFTVWFTDQVRAFNYILTGLAVATFDTPKVVAPSVSITKRWL